MEELGSWEVDAEEVRGGVEVEGVEVGIAEGGTTEVKVGGRIRGTAPFL